MVDYPTIQEAIQANPGKMIFVPAGDYLISEKIQITSDRSGLFGPGRIIQKNPDAPIIEIEKRKNVRLHDLTLTRAEGKMDTGKEGVIAIQCEALRLDDLQIVDNRTNSAAIVLRECRRTSIRDCLVQNYSRVTVDDRTANPDWGYAFKCIDGKGIAVTYSEGIQIEGCRIVEDNLLSTRSVKKKHSLGDFVKKNKKKGNFINQGTWDAGYVDNWHQGTGIFVSAPDASDRTQILGNTIENAGQGIDIHSDHVIVSQNIIYNAFMGLKAMHGSRNIVVIGNQFIRNDLWSIGMMPGAASYPASKGEKGGKNAAGANEDGASIIANNIISDFGYGDSHWIWGNKHSPFKFDSGQKPENPPLRDVIVQGNIVYGGGRNQNGRDEPAQSTKARYRYAVIVADEVRGLIFSNNILHPGTEGVANVDLKNREKKTDRLIK